jgi:hypothetical protein
MIESIKAIVSNPKIIIFFGLFWVGFIVAELAGVL